MPEGAAQNARARVRDELTREITGVARAQLAQQGSAALSLRAIAREMGMVSSAIYRYFPSRDDLLTQLIIDAYNAVGTAAEQAARDVPSRDPLGRWLAVTHATRTWALAHREEYALIFGSPVPGYQAPQDTNNPAARIPFLLLQVVAEARAASPTKPTPPTANPDDAELALPAPPASVVADLAQLRALLPEPIGAAIGEPLLGRAVAAWTMLIGTISFELFGHLNNVIYDYTSYFDYQMRTIAAGMGLTPSAG